MSTHDSIDFSQLPGVVICKDKEGRFLWANNEAVKIAGFDDFSQMAGKTDYDESVSWHEGAVGYRKPDVGLLGAKRVQEFPHFKNTVFNGNLNRAMKILEVIDDQI